MYKVCICPRLLVYSCGPIDQVLMRRVARSSRIETDSVRVAGV